MFWKILLSFSCLKKTFIMYLALLTASLKFFCFHNQQIQFLQALAALDSSLLKIATGTTIASSALLAKPRWWAEASSLTQKISSAPSAPSRSWCKRPRTQTRSTNEQPAPLFSLADRHSGPHVLRLLPRLGLPEEFFLTKKIFLKTN